MEYTYTTDRFTILLVAAIVLLAVGCLVATRGMVGVLSARHGRPVRSLWRILGGGSAMTVALVVVSLFPVNSFDVSAVQEMLRDTGYLLSTGLPRDYSSPIPVETVDGRRCSLRGGVKTLFPEQTYGFMVHCPGDDASPPKHP